MKTRLLLSGLVLMAVGTGLAQQQTTAVQHLPPQSATSATAKPAGEEEHAPTAKPEGANHEGIKVHGHWIIDVKNADGSYASHTEFENSLVTPNAADALLASILNGNTVLGGFAIGVDSSTPGALCPTALTGANIPINSCYLVLTTNPSANLVAWYLCNPSPGYPSFACFPNMINNFEPASYAGDGLPLNPAYFQLKGSFTAPAAGPITGVHTYLFDCSTYPGSSTTTENCIANNSPRTIGFSAFTSTTLATPINIVAGQYVTVTVNISFS